MKAIILGKGLAAWILARDLISEFDEITMIGEDDGLLASFDGFDKGGHVYGGGAINVLETNGIQLTKQSIPRKAYYVERLDTSAVWWPYPVQGAMKTEPKGNPVYHGQSLEEFAIEMFGDEFYKKWYQPFNARVWGTNPSNMDCDWTVGRVAPPSEANQKPQAWGPNSEFKWLLGDHLMDQVRFNSPRLKVAHGEFRYVAHDGDRLHVSTRDVTDFDAGRKADFIFSTIPINRVLYSLTGKLAGGMVEAPELFRNTVTSIGLSLNTRINRDFSWLYMDVVSPIHRITLYSRYSDHRCPTDQLLLEVPHPASFMPATGSSMNMSTSTLNAVHTALQLIGVDPNSVVRTSHCTHAGYPVPVIGHRGTVAAAKRELLSHNVLTCGRWGSHGYYNVDHTIMDAHSCARAWRHFFGKGETVSTEIVEGNYFTSDFYYKQAMTK